MEYKLSVLWIEWDGPDTIVHGSLSYRLNVGLGDFISATSDIVMPLPIWMDYVQNYTHGSVGVNTRVLDEALQFNISSVSDPKELQELKVLQSRLTRLKLLHER